MKKYIQLYTLLLIVIFCASCKGTNKAELPKDTIWRFGWGASL